MKPPCPRLHFHSLASALGHIRGNLAYVMHALQRWEDHEWPGVEGTVGRELCFGALLLGGVLEGLAILVSDLPDLPDLPDRDAAGALPAEFWTLAGFWKHYPPHQPRPTVFDRLGGAKDISVELADGSDSGPVMRDILVPAFDHACGLMRVIAPVLQESFESRSL